ncbi:MAG: hypothetical protein LUH07_05085 [Lachnospiraceae bacterium]|nr:hypothetical protein [Lachnospiraceae bacterium]
MDIPENQQKYYNYKVQMQRLKKAMDNQFYLEAIFIEYVIMEDRTASILRYEENTIKPKSENEFVSLDRKINKIIKISENKKGIARRYFSEEFMREISAWKDRRNSLMHALMKQKLTTEELRSFADEGEELVKKLSRLSQNYKRYLERHGILKEDAKGNH